MSSLRLLLAPLAFSACLPVLGSTGSYSPHAEEDFPRQVFWGDTHVHSAWSVDAAVLGRTTLPPETAYRFARGEAVTATNGMRVKLRRPLDFLLLSDHAEYLGLMQQIHRSDPLLLASPTGKRWHDMFKSSPEARHKALFEILPGLAQPDQIGSIELRSSVWQQVTANADRFNQPGAFTAFIGYEWTSSLVNGDNLHRNVIFRDSAEQANSILPFSAQDSTDPEQLWQFLAGYEQDSGGRVMAIPHNGNLSNGQMFASQRLNGDPLDADYVSTRARWEKVYEVTQIKGDGEAHPLLSPNDEFADYENWDTGNLGSNPKPRGALQFEYARSALQLGLAHEEQFGTNPFQFGMIGSTDSHTALATGDEDNFFGKFSKNEPAPGRFKPTVLPPGPDESLNIVGWQSVASGYAAVWARENTRAALFDALERKEVYATTGPRMTVRLFGGFDFQPGDELAPDHAALGYRKGVPMGAELTAAPAGRAPSFLVAASRDPEGANLDRIQIIKGWLTRDGELREKVYNVAAGGRDIVDNTVAAVGDTVNVQAATYRNSIGAAQLQALWTDPDFDPGQRAFYYARVLEIPTPRWTAYDARFFALETDGSIPMTTRERAYTSPIWYRPTP